MSELNLEMRDSGVKGAGTIPWGEHLCFFYNGKQEGLNLVTSFVAAGLQDNEFCMWITGGLVTERDAIQALEPNETYPPRISDGVRHPVTSKL